MLAQDLLLNRSSMPRLKGPGPDSEALALLQKAALRVPDHLSLTPYKVVVFEGEARSELGDLFYATADYEELGAQAVARAAELPMRAPLVLMVVTQYQDHDKVPKTEQFASAACAAHAIVQMAHTLGYGAIWRTGPYAESQFFKDQLGYTTEDILGFIYIGTPAVDIPVKPEKDKVIFESYSA